MGLLERWLQRKKTHFLKQQLKIVEIDVPPAGAPVTAENPASGIALLKIYDTLRRGRPVDVLSLGERWVLKK